MIVMVPPPPTTSEIAATAGKMTPMSRDVDESAGVSRATPRAAKSSS
jgi:hypothetical protein